MKPMASTSQKRMTYMAHPPSSNAFASPDMKHCLLCP